MHSQQSEVRRTYRRARVPLSCDPCRSRKLKCNREWPCQNCTARDEQAACKFRGPTVGRADRPSDGNTVATVPVSRVDAIMHHNNFLRQRIEHLEEVLRRLVAELTPQTSPKPDPVLAKPQVSDDTSGAGAAGATGKTVMEGIHSVYVGGDDWSLVLQEINEVKKAWSHEHDDNSDQTMRLPPSHTVDGSSLLFDQVKPLERMAIISSLPPKHEVDGLVARFFDSASFPLTIPPIIHEPTFRREYDEHWRDPSRTEFIWLGLLFSIISITMLAFHQYGEPPEYEGLSESLFQFYRMRTAQCLLSGDIAKCLPYTVETLRFNATAELNRKDDNRRGLWIMTGVIVRAAINMGYHRDPARLPGISALQAEYRRRVWSSVVSLDDMASFLGGFPRTMAAVYSDTLEPRNLHDWELIEGMNALPEARPLTEATAVTYLIAKSRLLRELGRVADFNSDPTLGSYEKVIEIDCAIQGAYESLPAFMRVFIAPPRSQLQQTSPEPARSATSFSILSLIGMYHRGVCTLHRKFLAKGHVDGRFELSHDRCISSALALLSFQEVLVPAFYKISQTRQMLMLGCLILFHELALRRKSTNGGYARAVPASDVLLAALERSCSLLAAAMDGCDEAKRLHHTLNSMLVAFRAGPRPITPEATPPESEDFQANTGSPDFGFSNDSFAFDKNWVDMDFDWVCFPSRFPSSLVFDENYADCSR
ncbi:hypothetical protein BD289DRAFT_374918 [Coniella lustricola]|uniref:Zn(2)-C6 fungal-type domain-containing protein n=1 Tax=Coniella lustricola TaxID=2025994 RepID=A0A2T2ZZ13_9PEZI|nr:hypothetical protein BD289DRAFT_374918 [Coniella lustricola]